MTLKQIKPQPRSNVVRHLREALRRAEDGELQNVVICGRLNGGDYFTAFDTDDAFSSIASVELIKHSLLNFASNGAEET